MARPKSDTIDYFTHDVDASERKTLTVIEGSYGIAGYAFWYKLLERLGKSEGHYFNASNPTDLEFLSRKCGSDVVSGTGILDKLAEIDAIDRILWTHGVVWSQNFVNRLEDVYKKRGRPLPLKPNFCNGNCDHSDITGGILGTGTDEKAGKSGVSTPKTPQTKLKEIKGNNSKGNKTTTTTPTPPNEKLLSSFPEEVKEKDIFVLWEEEIGKITPTVRDTLIDAIEHFGEDWVRDAIKEASRSNKKDWRYIEGILKNWARDGKDVGPPGQRRDRDTGKYFKGKYGHMVSR